MSKPISIFVKNKTGVKCSFDMVKLFHCFYNLDEHICGRTISAPGQVFTKTDYLTLYDGRHHCSWTIQSPTKDTYPLLNISKIILAEQEMPKKVCELNIVF